MEAILRLSDAELRDELAEHIGSTNVPPVTETTRRLIQRKLFRLRSGRDFVSVCSNPADGDSEDGDSAVDTSTQLQFASSPSPASAAAAASAAALSFDATPLRSPAAASGGGGGAGGSSIFRETYRRRPLHEGGEAGAGTAGDYAPTTPGRHSLASSTAAAAASGTSQGTQRTGGRRPSLITVLLVVALLIAVGFVLLHTDPLYKNPVPEISQ